MMATKIFKNRLEFIARTDFKINGVSKEFADLNPKFESENKTNNGCWNCSRCFNCFNCFNLSDGIKDYNRFIKINC